MATTDKPAGDDKVFDIASPGNSMPSMNARPVITTHRSITSRPPSPPSDGGAPDDASDSPTTGEGAEAVLTRPKKTVLQPLHPTLELDDEPSDSSQGAQEEKPADDEMPELPIETVAEEPTESVEAEDSPSQISTEEQGSVNETVHDPGEAVAADEVVDVDAAAQEKFDALIASGKYHVRINERAAKRRAAVVVSILLVIITLCALYALVASEILDIGIELPKFW